MPASGCTLLVDRADGAGPRIEASCGQSQREPAATRIPIALTAPWSADLLIGAPAGTAPRALSVAGRLLGLALDRQRLHESDRDRQHWLTFLVEVSDLLAQSLDLTLTLALIPRLVVPRLGQWSGLYLQEPSGRARLATVAHIDEARVATMLDTEHEFGSQLHPQHISAALSAPPGVPLPPPLSGFAVPLVAQGEQIGSLVIGRTQRPSSDEVTIAAEIAHRASAAITNARVHEERRRVAHTLQRSLLPSVLPRVPGLDVGACYLPSGNGIEVGGDLYDVLAMPDGRWLAVVGDVSGKGIQAAAATGLVREVIRILISDGKPVEDILAVLNTTLHERSQRYCTLALGAINPPEPATGLAEVCVYLAGHDRPLLLDANGAVTPVGTYGTALGLIPRSASTPTQIILKPGDTLIFFTDGVTERRQGQDFFGHDRVLEALTTLAGHPADVIAYRIATMARDFSAEPARDDIAVLAIRNTA